MAKTLRFGKILKNKKSHTNSNDCMGFTIIIITSLLPPFEL